MSDEAKKQQAALVRLTKNQDFIEWLALFREMREAALDGMEGATTEKLHQIAGAVSVYNAVLNNAKVYAALEKRDKKQE